VDANHDEVVWSDVINAQQAEAAVVQFKRRTEEALALARPAPVSGKDALTAQIKDILADQASRQFVTASVPAGTSGAPVAAGVHPTVALAGPQALFNIPGLECIDDFADYLLQNDMRSQVIDRFNRVVQPLLQQPGLSIHVISHSWGTVVAYEALRGLDGASQFASGAIATLFTAGAALSIAPVKRMLLPGATSKASEMYFRKIRPSTTCLYSAASRVPRSLSAAAQRLASKLRSAFGLLDAMAIPGFSPYGVSRDANGDCPTSMGG
jgi:hypothetical protein